MSLQFVCARCLRRIRRHLHDGDPRYSQQWLRRWQQRAYFTPWDLLQDHHIKSSKPRRNSPTPPPPLQPRQQKPQDVPFRYERFPENEFFHRITRNYDQRPAPYSNPEFLRSWRDDPPPHLYPWIRRTAVRHTSPERPSTHPPTRDPNNSEHYKTINFSYAPPLHPATEHSRRDPHHSLPRITSHDLFNDLEPDQLDARSLRQIRLVSQTGFP